MALEFSTIEGFEWASNSTDLRDKYSLYESAGFPANVWNIDTGTFKTGTQSLKGGNGTAYGDFQFPIFSSATIGLPANSIKSVHMGFHLYVNTVGTLWTGALFNMYNYAAAQQGFLKFNAAGQPIVYRSSGTLLATGSVAIAAGTWHWVEIFHAIDNGSGRWIVEIDEATSIDFTGDTEQYTTGMMYCRLETPRLAGYHYFLDNLFVKTSASLESDPTFYGACYVNSLYPDADGNYTAWNSTASPTIYTEIDSAQVDTDSPYTYISSSTTNDKVSCSHGALVLDNPLNDVIVCASLEHQIKKDTAGAGTVTPFLRKGGSDYSADELGVPYGEFERKQVFWENDPSSSPETAWTVSDIDNTEFGIEYT